MTLLMAMSALILDRLLGEPNNDWHPLVGFGQLAQWLEKRLNNTHHRPLLNFSLGLLSLLLLVGLPVALLIGLLMLLPLWVNFLVQTLVLMFCLGWHSLREHSFAIARPLAQGELTQARQALAMIVTRDTQTLNETAMAKATCESVLENGHDALFASLFWFVLLGAPAALAHRLINTLDGMWGYRNVRFEYFGKSAARCDDLLGYIPARLTALSYAIVGKHTRHALSCAWRQGRQHDSPNAGLVMAAGAGALGVRLGGGATYQGLREKRPHFGWGNPCQATHIQASLSLIDQSVVAWLLVIAALSL
nr:cobalamin biosynthesis protein CobD [Gammaproteobacteria bacterium]